MCKKTNYHKTSNTRIDKCMRNLINFIDDHSNAIEVVACCCGHNKYPMTIIVKGIGNGVFDLMSGVIISRTINFYKKDKQGYYYIPEVVR